MPLTPFTSAGLGVNYKGFAFIVPSAVGGPRSTAPGNIFAFSVQVLDSVSKVFVLDSSGSIFEFDNPDNDINTMTYTGNFVNLGVLGITQPRAFSFNVNEDVIIISSSTTGLISQIELPTRGTIVGATNAGLVFPTGLVGDLGYAFTSVPDLALEDTRLYYVHRITGEVFMMDMVAPADVSSAVLISNTILPTHPNTIQQMQFSGDGKYLIFNATLDKAVRRTFLPTPYDTGVFVQDRNVIDLTGYSPGPDSTRVVFSKPSGNRMYILAEGAGTLTEFVSNYALEE